MFALVASSLVGCSSLDSVNPVNWWHDLEGGPIADARPPPPNADAPYRNLADAPSQVPANDAAARGQIAEALIADRANAVYAASLAPLAAAPPTPARPATPKQPPAASADASNATLPAASAPPPAARPAPATPVKTADLPPPAATPNAAAPNAAAPNAAAPNAAASAPPTDAPPADLPPVPQNPPPPPALAGVPGTIAPTPPPATPPPKPASPAPLVVGAPLSVGFARGSASLPSAALPGLKLLVRTRGVGAIAITGFGEATSSTPEAQQAAMPLAMARVRAVAGYLLAEGVPSSALRIDGEAQGSGAVVRPIN